ncbi:hypothetical protein [Acrocarpospora sp. B8E8]|uniref:hypothetical protein n=1 Tax=Acrocarpospora sp. B8E8 TaxID=3153572 RepID=UPI00325EE965
MADILRELITAIGLLRDLVDELLLLALAVIGMFTAIRQARNHERRNTYRGRHRAPRLHRRARTSCSTTNKRSRRPRRRPR